MNMTLQLYIPAFAAMLATAFVFKFTEKNSWFGWWPPIADRFLNNFWLELAYRCEYCIAGQIALWLSVWWVYAAKNVGTTEMIFYPLWNIVFALFLTNICTILYKYAQRLR